MNYATYEVDQSDTKDHVDMIITLQTFFGVGEATLELEKDDGSGNPIKIKDKATMILIDKNTNLWIAIYKGSSQGKDGIWRFWLNHSGARDSIKYPNNNGKPHGSYPSYLKYNIIEEIDLSGKLEISSAQNELVLQQGNGTGTAGNTGGN